MADSRVVVVGGVRLVPPKQAGDCTCVFCSTFRAQHLWWRALAVSLTLPLPLLFAVHLARLGLHGGTQIVGAVLIVTTAWTVAAVAVWYQPARRAVHRARPRETSWPPR
jgi:hypothetical protein